jgi:FlaA1/EpsC-like NDP-sugar epimerase
MPRLNSHYRKILVLLFHASAVVSAIVLAFLLRFELLIPRVEMAHVVKACLGAMAVKLPILSLSRIDKTGWRYIGIQDLFRMLRTNLIASVAFTILMVFVVGQNFPRSVYCVDFLLCFLLVVSGPLMFRSYHDGILIKKTVGKRQNVLIYGAGAAAVTLIKELKANPILQFDVVGLLDDNRQKRSMRLLGVPVVGSGRDAARLVARYSRWRDPIELILIAMPSASSGQMRDAVANCRAAGVPFKTVPGMGELISGRVLIHQIRDVSVVDLLGRNPVHLDWTAVREFLRNKSVMVTGAGGSIGSELCRQIARFEPAQLIALDQAESDLFRIQLELKTRHQGLNLVPELADIRNFKRLDEVIQRYSVDCIFHAAAYKHVPMMEAHPLEAVRNNVLGTWNLVEAASRHGVSDFVMISSDKAVNPTNVMGLTKRIAELILASRPTPAVGAAGTKFVAVRFGNVLGSNGSVVPVFKQQIEAGGPVTVTHPDITRYFMTINEAVELVLQASTIGKGSEIFVLDMGEPVRIADLAENLIRLSGHEPGKDIEIRYVGLRPGEKLNEELKLADENILPTFHQKIKIFQGSPVRPEEIDWTIQTIEGMLARGDEVGAIRSLWMLAPEYEPDQPWRDLLEKNPQLVAAISGR